MQILLNGDATDLADGCTLAALVEHLELAGRRMAVEVNEEIVPRSRYRECSLKEGDRVEIVHAVGGG